MKRAAALGRAARPLAGVLVVALLVGAAASLWRWGARAEDVDDERGDREHPIVTAPRIVVQDGQTRVRLDPAALRRAALRVQAVQREELPESREALATVVDVQPLLDLTLALHTADARVAAAQARVDLTRAAYERAQRLYDDQQNVSAAQLQSARASYESDQAALAEARIQADADRTALRLHWGPALAGASSSSDAQDSRLSADLFARREVLLQVTLPPEMSDQIPPATGHVVFDDRNGPRVQRLGPAAYADPRLAGRSYLYRAVADAALLPGASLTVRLETGRRAQAVRVPASAVVWWQGRAWVYLQTAETDFVRHEVPAESVRGDSMPLADLPDGSRVVVQGAQVLLSEELRAQNSSTDVGGR